MHLIIVTLILVSVTSGARFRTPSSEVEEIDHEDLEHFGNDHERLSKVLELQDLSEEIKELEHERAIRELASIEEVMSNIRRDRRGIFADLKEKFLTILKQLVAKGGKDLIIGLLRALLEAVEAAQ